MFNKLKEKFNSFDPKIKMLIMIMVVITVIVVFVYGGDDNVDEPTYEDGQKEIKKIDEDQKAGYISRSSASRKSSGIRSTMGTAEDSMKKRYSNMSDYTGLPEWAVRSKIPEVTGLTLVPDKSIIIEPNEKYKRAFAAVYTGGREDLMTEAKRISKKAELIVITDTGYTYAAKGGMNDYSMVISVSSNLEELQLKYGVSEIN